MNKIAKAYNLGNKIYESDKKNVVILGIKYFKVIKAFWKLFCMKSNIKIETMSRYQVLISTKDWYKYKGFDDWNN